MFKKYNLIVVFIFFTTLCSAQGVVLEYELLPVLAPCTSYENEALQKKLDVEKGKLERKTSEVIAICPEQMHVFTPQSPLSNFLTDLMVVIANDYCRSKKLDSVDFALLNYRGIRTFMPAGDVTIGKMYEIFPFDNELVIIDIKGSELKKVFKRFNNKPKGVYSKDVTIQYLGDYPVKILVHQTEIDENRIYRFVTLDFVMTGGDDILTNAVFEKIVGMNEKQRDVMIDYVSKMGKENISLTGKIDNRAVVLPQP